MKRGLGIIAFYSRGLSAPPTAWTLRRTRATPSRTQPSSSSPRPAWLPRWWPPAPPQSRPASCTPISRLRFARGSPLTRSWGPLRRQRRRRPPARGLPPTPRPLRRIPPLRLVGPCHRNGLLYRLSPRGDCLCVPGALQTQGLQELHATPLPGPLGGHCGRDKTLALARRLV